MTTLFRVITNSWVRVALFAVELFPPAIVSLPMIGVAVLLVLIEQQLDAE